MVRNLDPRTARGCTELYLENIAHILLDQPKSLFVGSLVILEGEYRLVD